MIWRLQLSGIARIVQIVAHRDVPVAVDVRNVNETPK